MKQAVIGIGVVVSLVLCVGFIWWSGTYTGLVNRQEAVKMAAGQVQNQYQRRADLVPNLVEVVKGYAAHEKGTFEAVTKARQQIVNVNVADLATNAAAQQQFIKAQGELSSALTRLLAVKEAYPDLKANQNFLALQTQLEGTENRIAVERKRWQEATASYNIETRGFFSGMVASHYGFAQMPYFEAEAGAQTAPKVSFAPQQQAER